MKIVHGEHRGDGCHGVWGRDRVFPLTFAQLSELGKRNAIIKVVN
ncbi:MAG: hypothetical protein ACRCT1_17805 [Microcoleaceae cyanobacterium]